MDLLMGKFRTGREGECGLADVWTPLKVQLTGIGQRNECAQLLVDTHDLLLVALG